MSRSLWNASGIAWTWSSGRQIIPGPQGKSPGKELPEASETVLVAGQLRGYRYWRVDDVGSRLLAMTNGTRWDTELTAECMTGFGLPGHVAPEKECECGIYARHTPGRSNDYIRDQGYFDQPFGLLPGTSIPGVIEATGRVRLGPLGFRAEHARILAIATMPVERLIVHDLVDPRATVLPTGRVHSILLLHIEGDEQGRSFHTLMPPMENDLPIVQQKVLTHAQQKEDEFRKQYPDVKVYYSTEEMVRDYPPIPIGNLTGQRYFG